MEYGKDKAQKFAMMVGRIPNRPMVVRVKAGTGILMAGKPMDKLLGHRSKEKDQGQKYRKDMMKNRKTHGGQTAK